MQADQANEKFKQELDALAGYSPSLASQAEGNSSQTKAQFGGAIGGYGTCLGSLGQPAPIGIQERVENDLNRAYREARKAEALHELNFLLQKNPDVARILDLVEMVRG